MISPGWFLAPLAIYIAIDVILIAGIILYYKKDERNKVYILLFLLFIILFLTIMTLCMYWEHLEEY